eukprot:3033114-Pleurochrysis_carterae.AAC.2
MRRSELRLTRRQQSKWHKSSFLQLSTRRLGWAHQNRAAKKRRRADVVEVNKSRGAMRPRKPRRSQPASRNKLGRGGGQRRVRPSGCAAH